MGSSKMASAKESHVNEGFVEVEEEIVTKNDDHAVAKASTDYDTFAIEAEEEEERVEWDNKCDFLLSALGTAIGLGNIWRFPYLVYENGGGTFLVPYTIMLFVAGLPVYFLELALGQYAGQGPTRIYGRMAPIFKGLGFAMLMITFVVGVYYNVIIAWAVYYMFAGMQKVLPWSVCSEDYSSKYCYNLTDPGTTSNYSMSAPEDYFYSAMLGLQTQNEHDWSNFGIMHWELVLCLLAAWLMVGGALIKGVQSSGKVVYFTAIFPFVVLFILFIVGCTLPGAGQGVLFYVTPNATKLGEVEVWRAAANQIFYSLGPAFGGVVTLASYNKFNNNCHRDAFIIAFGNCLTSVFAGFVVFSILGYMANLRGVEVQDVVQSGPSLAFIAFPEAIAEMKSMGSAVPPLMSFLFFTMLLTLGLDSMFTMVETLTTAILDQFRALKAIKEYVVIAVCVIGFLCGLSMCTSGGFYMFTLIDAKSASWNLLLVAFLEVILVGWVYGADRFLDNIKDMDMKLGPFFHWYWKICWQYITPAIMFILILFSWINHEPAKVGDYTFPWPAQLLGWMMGLGSILLMIFGSAWNVYKRYRNGKEITGIALLRTTPKWRPKTSTGLGASTDKLDEDL